MSLPSGGKAQPPELRILSVGELLADTRLAIPTYQRPYKWIARHVGQLWSDLVVHQGKPTYRLGTVVLHREVDKGNERLNIVDGQQRIVTLLLIVQALLERPLESWKDPALIRSLRELADQRFKPSFSNPVSQGNIWRNFREIKRRVTLAASDEALFCFLLQRCEVVCVTLDQLSEAFQFFDAQNARGRDLEPHDLLKAFHLREFSPAEAPLKAGTVRTWENSPSRELATLFATYLHRIRCWCQGKPAGPFTKQDIDGFKGVSLHRSARYPFAAPLRMVHHGVDDYNAHFTRHLDAQSMAYPHQLDQPVINGRRFFEMVSHYQAMGFHRPGAVAEGDARAHRPAVMRGLALTGRAERILEILGSYGGRHRKGDKFVRSIFDCLLMYYMDKFGEADISAAIEKAFIWAYSLRLNKDSVHLESMNKHVLARNLFTVLRHAVEPHQFLGVDLPMVREASNRQHLDRIKDLFREMGYLEIPQ